MEKSHISTSSLLTITYYLPKNDKRFLVKSEERTSSVAKGKEETDREGRRALGYSPWAKIPTLDAYEQARRALSGVCEPIPSQVLGN